MKKVISLLATAIAVLCSCQKGNGNQNQEPPKEEIPSIIGTWNEQYTIVHHYVGDKLESSTKLDNGGSTFTFNEDMTFSLMYDKLDEPATGKYEFDVYEKQDVIILYFTGGSSYGEGHGYRFEGDKLVIFDVWEDSLPQHYKEFDRDEAFFERQK